MVSARYFMFKTLKRSLNIDNVWDAFLFYQRRAVKYGFPVQSLSLYRKFYYAPYRERITPGPSPGPTPTPLPSYCTSGDKALTFGAGAATYVSPPNNAPANAGWTLNAISSVYQNNIAVNLNYFNVVIDTSIYATTYFSTSTYITFGSSSTNSTSLSASNPAISKVMLGAGDHSYQRCWQYEDPSGNYVRFRYEGTAATSGTPGSPNIVYEFTFFNPANYSGSQVFEVLMGNNSASSSAPFLVANTSSSYASSTVDPNTSYVFVGNSTGTSWTIYKNAYITSPGY